MVHKKYIVFTKKSALLDSMVLHLEKMSTLDGMEL
jgi:hypothetical protein